MATPPRPAVFASDRVPVGVELDLVTFSNERPLIDTRAIHFHTNAASREGTIEGAKRHIYAAPGVNTLPHYQVDRTHDGRTRACKFLDTSRRGIGSTTVGPSTSVNGRLVWPTLTDVQRATILAHPNVRNHTIVIETADTGYLTDPSISPYDPGQLEMCATILAFESIVHGFPLVMQVNYWDAGVGSHTDPWGFPYTTIHRGKFCPGTAKKLQLRTMMIQRARAIVAAWTGITPTPPPTPTPTPPPQVGTPTGEPMILIAKEVNDGPFWLWVVGSPNRYHVSDDFPGALTFADGPKVDLGSAKQVTSWGACVPVTRAQVDAVMPQRAT